DLLLLDQRDVALSVDWGDPRRSRAASERLAQRAAVLPYVFGLFIVAPNGDILASSMRDVPPLSAADREYFVAQQATDQGLLISEPLYSRVSGEPIMVLSRRVSGPDGSFAGVV